MAGWLLRVLKIQTHVLSSQNIYLLNIRPIFSTHRLFKKTRTSVDMTAILGIDPVKVSKGDEVPNASDGDPAGLEGGSVGAQGDDGNGAEENQSAFSKLSNRARKRFKRNQERLGKLEGRGPKRKKKNEDRPINFTDEMLCDADYYIENGLRKVYPYAFNYTTYAKGRWVGKNILDMFDSEFQAYDRSQYEATINAGRLLVNGNKVTTDYVFKDNDYVENIVHRHELPVTAAHIPVVLETDDVIVVDKPSSIPIHPCGRFRHNSLTYILAKDYSYKNLRSIYRLDRLTSGVFIMCKTEKQTQLMQGHIKNRQVEKTYVAKVVGEFPSDKLECCEPIDILSQKIGLFKVGPNGKEASTQFQRLSYDGTNSIVMCKPHTGRTHQIRVHLQYLGFPITNDPLYNTEVWGPNQGKGGDYGKPEEQLIADIIAHHTATRFTICETTHLDNSTEDNESTDTSPSTDNTQRLEASTDQQLQGATSAKQLPIPGDKLPNNQKDIATTSDTSDDTHRRFDASKLTVDALCKECKKVYKDPKPEELVMYLHALSYSGPGWKYETELPSWAGEKCTPATIKSVENCC